jgi:hypothetical protein
MKDRFQEVMTNRPANRPVILTKSVSEHMEHYSDIHKLELTGLLRINVNQAFKNGWKKIVNGAKYKFLADSDFIDGKEVDGLRLYINGSPTQHFFMVYDREHKGCLKRGRYEKQEPMGWDRFVYYAVDCGKRYQHIYINFGTGRIGTRRSLNCIYGIDCLKSDTRSAIAREKEKDKETVEAIRSKRRARNQRYKEKKQLKQLATRVERLR